MEKFSCECGAIINKKQLSTHRKTKKHLNFINKKTLDLTNNPEPDEPDEPDEHDDDEPDEPDDYEEQEESEEELVVDEVKRKKDIKEMRREHLNKIRAKAHEVIKQKKIQRIQQKIDKEMELQTKAKLYDDMLEQQKKEKEERIRKEQENKEKEMKKKLTDYDKILEENLRLKAQQNKQVNLQQYAQSALLDEIKQERLKFLSRQLGVIF